MFHKIDCPFCEIDKSLNKQQHNTKALDWSFVPIAVCINMVDRKDRFEHSMREFHRVGLCDKIQYYFATTSSNDNESNDGESNTRRDQPNTRGCWESHQNVAQIFASLSIRNNKNQYDFALVFEDDVLFEQDLIKIQKALESIKQFINHNSIDKKAWNMIHLGCWPIWIQPQINLSTIFAKNRYTVNKTHARCFHAYFISKRFAQKFANIHWSDQFEERPEFLKRFPGFGVDTFLAYNSRKSFTVFPIIAYQANLSSSNNRAINQKMIDFCLSDPLYMKLNQFFIFFASIFLLFFSSIFKTSSINYRFKQK